MKGAARLANRRSACHRKCRSARTAAGRRSACHRVRRRALDSHTDSHVRDQSVRVAGSPTSGQGQNPASGARRGGSNPGKAPTPISSSTRGWGLCQYANLPARLMLPADRALSPDGLPALVLPLAATQKDWAVVQPGGEFGSESDDFCPQARGMTSTRPGSRYTVIQCIATSSG